MKTKTGMKKYLALAIAIFILGIIAWIGLQTDNSKKVSVDTESIKMRIKDEGGFEVLGEILKPKRFWKKTPEWDAYQLIKKNYSGFPVEIKKNLKTLFDWIAFEIESGYQENKLLKRRLIGTKKKLYRKLWERLRKEK